MVEQGTENPRVVGSIPIGGTIYADLAHLVERDLAKVEVAGSSPVIRSSTVRCVVVRLIIVTVLNTWKKAECSMNIFFQEEYGGLAQLGEHLPYKQRVTGSSPVPPTKKILIIQSFNHGSVVQLVRTPACHAGGHGFEPHSSRQHLIRSNADLCF